MDLSFSKEFGNVAFQCFQICPFRTVVLFINLRFGSYFNRVAPKYIFSKKQLTSPIWRIRKTCRNLDRHPVFFVKSLEVIFSSWLGEMLVRAPIQSSRSISVFGFHLVDHRFKLLSVFWQIANVYIRVRFDVITLPLFLYSLFHFQKLTSPTIPINNAGVLVYALSSQHCG